MSATYDLIVVGAGPAGSTAARAAAGGGAKVLLINRAAFPRDKPCGGGVNVRAARLLPFSLDPVSEREIYGLNVTVNLGRPFARRSARPLCFMTQRCRLDAFLVEHALKAGVALRDGVAVRGLTSDRLCVRVQTGAGEFRGRVLIGADGANGIVATTSGLAGGRRLAVAIEANYPWAASVDERWTETIGMDLALIRGGYGWLFPKSDHVNIGVGGWQHFGPTLRSRLDRLAAMFGKHPEQAIGLRGHRLPVRTADAPLASERVMLAGDAAGLVDPLSGEGIYAAIYSGRRAAEEALSALETSDPDCRGYERALRTSLCLDLLASQRFQDVFHLMPSLYARMLRRSDRLWDLLCAIVRGDQTYLDLRHSLGPFASLLDVLSELANTAPLRQRLGLTAA